MLLKTFFSVIIVMFLVSKGNGLYFTLKQQREKCFVDFFDNQGIGVVKYEVKSGFPTPERGSIQIKFFTESDNNFVSRHIIQSKKGKFSFIINSEGGYRICAYNIGSRTPVELSLKFENENVEEIDINNLISKEEINEISTKIDKSIRVSRKIINNQKSERENEEKVFLQQKKYSKLFIFLTIAQITILFCLGFYHIVSFRKYLVSHNLI